MIELTALEVERFWAKVDRSGTCWPWMAAVNNRGYGVTSVRRGTEKFSCLAHRRAYSLASGLEPVSLHHLCGNKLCCNPLHLQALAVRAHKGLHVLDICRNGHPFTPENTYRSKRGRSCRACNARWHRNKRHATSR